ncbi:MAG TPA: hypothetical protein VL134_12300 [Leptolyngbya sp.]|jgi:predicted  nucleic acid-binding Zn-ribbon protein|nr:hypothetical protein [Leptolyngbya sp.]
MKKQLQQRLQTLQTEFETGQKMLAELEAKQANLRETLLRMSGAIQVLQECLQTADSPLENHEPEANENGQSDREALGCVATEVSHPHSVGH